MLELDSRERAEAEYRRRGYIAAYYPPVRTRGSRIVNWLVELKYKQKRRR